MSFSSSIVFSGTHFQLTWLTADRRCGTDRRMSVSDALKSYPTDAFRSSASTKHLPYDTARRIQNVQSENTKSVHIELHS